MAAMLFRPQCVNKMGHLLARWREGQVIGGYKFGVVLPEYSTFATNSPFY